MDDLVGSFAFKITDKTGAAIISFIDRGVESLFLYTHACFIRVNSLKVTEMTRNLTRIWEPEKNFLGILSQIDFEYRFGKIAALISEFYNDF